MGVGQVWGAVPRQPDPGSGTSTGKPSLEGTVVSVAPLSLHPSRGKGHRGVGSTRAPLGEVLDQYVVCLKTHDPLPHLPLRNSFSNFSSSSAH